MDRSGYAADLMRAGTPNVSKLLVASITPLVASVDVGDSLPVDLSEKGWTVSKDGSPVGRLTWSVKQRGKPDPRTGVPMFMIEHGLLHVRTVQVLDGVVVNCGGYVTPI